MGPETFAGLIPWMLIWPVKPAEQERIDAVSVP